MCSSHHINIVVKSRKLHELDRGKSNAYRILVTEPLGK
jgi:hypothetical protein